MIQYKDYFSRRELFYLGIDSEKEIDGLSKEFYGENRNEAIDLEMKSIYRFIKASQEKMLLNENAKKTANDILINNVSKRIVAAFYELGILGDLDLERFLLDYKIDEPTKTQITVSEVIEDESVNFEEVIPQEPSKEIKL
jgi:hypothetical protein